MYRILIVDDEPYTAHALAHMLEEKIHPEVDIYCVYSAGKAMDILRSGRVDVVITDIQMPDVTGIELTEQIQKLQPLCKILFFSAYSNFDYAYRAMKLNSSGYILKSEPDEVIVQGVQNVLEQLAQERNQLLLAQSSESRVRRLSHYLLSKLLGNDPITTVLLEEMLDFQRECFCILLQNNRNEKTEAQVCSFLARYGFFYLSASDDDSIFYLIQSKDAAGDLSLRILESMEELQFSLMDRDEPVPSFLISGELNHVQLFYETYRKLQKAAKELEDPPCVRICSSEDQAAFHSADGTIRFLRNYIDKHIAEDTSLLKLASVSGYNADYLSRIFHKETGQKLSGYISDKKLLYIRRLMKDTELDLDSVAKAAGFASRSYFNRFVKKKTGMTAEQLRRQCLQS